MSIQVQEPQNTIPNIQSFRVDVQLHDLLKKPSTPGLLPPPVRPTAVPEVLPAPVFPQHPELLLNHHPSDWDPRTHPENPYRRRWTAPTIYRALRGWLFPYVKSRVLPGDFHPIIAYLFTEWKCNLDCHYCWAFDNRVKGMTEDTAKRSIDWLHSTTCRVLALMGGEPLLRPQFAHKVIYYAAQKGFWVYLPPTRGCSGRKSSTASRMPALLSSTSLSIRLMKSLDFPRPWRRYGSTSII